MAPEKLAAIAGVAWLNAGIQRAPDPNELAGLVDDEPGVDSLALVMACVPIAEAVEYVVECRARVKSDAKPKRLVVIRGGKGTR
jgi:hypothetical protein